VGKIYSCYDTLQLESQRSGTFLSIIKTIFKLCCQGTLKRFATFIPMSMPLFSGAVAGEQRKALRTASFCKRRLFSDAATLFLAPCNFLSLGRLHNCESSHSFRFAKHFSFTCFYLFSSFCFLIL
jgi:hypothetical protein